jgi:hypothetical protein
MDALAARVEAGALSLDPGEAPEGAARPASATLGDAVDRALAVLAQRGLLLA